MMLKVDFQKLSEIGIFRKSKDMDGCWFELSTWAHDAIFDAGSNIASLLLIVKKNVVFPQQMLIFQDSVHSFK